MQKELGNVVKNINKMKLPKINQCKGLNTVTSTNISAPLPHSFEQA